VLPCVQNEAGRVDRLALEDHVGVAFTADDLVSPDAKLSGQRRRQANYRERLRARAGSDVAA